MTTISLGYVGLNVSDIEAWKAYARDFLGVMEAETSASGVNRLRIDDNAWRIALEPGQEDDLAYLGLEVAGPDEFEAVCNRLAQAGIDYSRASAEQISDRGVMDMVTCVDPAGMSIELHYGPKVASHIPFASPQGVRFVTGEQGFGHVAIATEANKIEAMRHFYLNALGFRQADTIRMTMGPGLAIDLEFYYGNPRHHTIALAPLPMPAPKRLHHLMLQTETIDEVGFALDRAGPAGVRITQSLGRHSNDKMISFYCDTPSGFELEYGHGAIEINAPEWRIARHDRISSWGHKRL